MSKKRKKQSISTRDASAVLILTWAVGLFCCLFLSQINRALPREQGIPGDAAYQGSTRLYSGRYSNTFSGLRLDFPNGEPLFLEDGMTPELAEEVEALKPGTGIFYLQEPDSGTLMALHTENRELLSYKIYAEASSKRAETIMWSGMVFLLLGSVFLIPIGQNAWHSRKYTLKKRK